MSDDHIPGDDEAEYTLITPFVVVKSVGGPYDDASFSAGIRYGRWRELMKLQPTQHSEYEPKELVPQLDLLAMEVGYSIETEPYDEFWTLVTLKRG